MLSGSHAQLSAGDRCRSYADRYLVPGPAFYFACPATVFGPHQDVPIAPGSAWQDFELEIAAVVGAAGADLSVEQAQKAIVGYTIFNDWSARDLQMLDGQLGIGQSGGKDSGITLGPYLVTPDELEPYLADGRLDLAVTALVNDEVIGAGSTSTMDWTFAEVITYASRGVPLEIDAAHGKGLTFDEAADAIDLGEYADWLDSERVVVNVYQRYRELEPQIPNFPPLAFLAMQADWHAKRGG